MMALQQIRLDVTEALFVTPVIVYPQGNANSMGDTTDSTPVTYHGYVYESAVIVINSMGQEELSNMQIYLTGNDAAAIALTALVTCLSAVKQRVVARKIYRGRQAATVIGILYLP